MTSAQKLSKAGKKEKNIIAEGYFTEGMKYYMVENFGEALNHFQKAFEIVPDNPGVNYMVAKTFVDLDKLEPAQQYIQKALKQDNKNKYYYLLQALIYEKKLEYQEAIKVYKKLLSEVPGTEEHYYDLAALYLYSNNPEEAIKTYAKVENFYGKSPEVTRQKQQIYLQLNKLNEALAEGQSLINSFPEEPEFKLRQAELLHANNKVNDAIKLLENVIKEHPGYTHSYAMLADIYKNQGQYDKAITCLHKVFSDPETDINIKIRLLNEFKKLPENSIKKESIVKLASDLIKIHPYESNAYAANGDIHYLHGQKRDALTSYLQSKRLNPDNYSLWAQILVIESELNEADSMIKHSEEALDFFPNQSSLWLFNGSGHMLKKNYKSAINSFEQGKKLSGGNTELKIQFLMSLGDAYNGVKDYKKSDEAYEEVLKFDSRNAHVLNNYSYFLSLRKERLEYAKTLCERLIKDYPTEATFLDTYAWVLYMLKDYEGAKKYLELAVKNSSNGTIVEHYGDVLFQLGEKDLALEQWRKAKELGETSELIDKKIRDKKLYE